MKKNLACVWLASLLLGGAVPASAGLDLGVASGWVFSADLWLAGQSTFDEQPGPEAAGHVWGDFGTNFYNFTVRKRLVAGLEAGLTYGLFTMTENNMYLHSPDLFTVISGGGTQIIPELGYHVVDLGMVDVAAGVGYQYASAVKHFNDLTDHGTVVQPGNWGDYKINYYGLIFSVQGAVQLPMGLGFEGKIAGSPFMNNDTEVTGYGDPLKEKADGLRFRFEGQVDYSPSPLIRLSAGYRYEDLYFREPAADSFSLAIKYGGPFFQGSVVF